ncbi:MAG: MBL fold metallo-hydrolase [Deferribacteraceae bacterium]|jgi:L-ascorbate metabolism protein UlaG (beta-lactamase superfamily)|nr:MBL fold metallo-hydrolase [Deferribacteraceae bacterium]
MVRRGVLIACLLLALLISACGGKELNEERILASPNFKDGQVVNREPSEEVASKSNIGMLKMFPFIFRMLSSEGKPSTPLPTIKTDLKSLDINDELFVWFGHSSYMVQSGGKRFLVDPIINEDGSPIPFINSPFKGSDIYKPSDIPTIDYLIVTHNHYDHAAKSTLKAIRDQVGLVICPLGVGKYLVDWGYPADKIVELDWEESFPLDDGVKIYCLTARHFSMRSTNDRNTTLWASFLLEIAGRKIYFGGDSGYGQHFKSIGKRFGTIDLAFLENGQYNERWRDHHMMPEDTLAAATDLNARYLMPVHNSKFKISFHTWNAPMIELAKLPVPDNMTIMRPLIGEVVPLWQDSYRFKEWWNID